MLPFEEQLPFEKLPFEDELPFERGASSKKQDAADRFVSNTLLGKNNADEELNQKIEKYKKKPSSVLGDLADISLPVGLIEQIPAGIQAGVGALSGLANYAIEGGETGAYERGKHWFSNTDASRALTPKTTSGQAIAGGIGALLGDMQDYYQQGPGAENMLKMIPFAGERLSKTPEAKAIVQAGGDTLLEALALEGGRQSLRPLLPGKQAPQGITEQAKIKPTIVLDELPFEKSSSPVSMKDAVQQELPFSTSVEKIAAEQAKNSPQLDMFVEQQKAAERFDPFQEGLNKEAFQDRAALEQAAQEAVKKQQMDEMFTQRPEQILQEQRLRELEARQDALDLQYDPRLSQRGAIDLEALKMGFRKIKQLDDGITLTYKGGKPAEGEAVVLAFKDGKQIGEVNLSPTAWGREPKITDNLSSTWTDSSKKGLAAEMYRFAAEQGHDIVPASVQTEGGRAMWNKFEREGLSTNKVIPRSQQGALNFKDISDSLSKAMEKLGSVPLARYAGKDAVDHAKAIPGMGKALDNLIIRPDAPEAVLPKIMAEKDGPFLIQGIQSGLQLTGEKVGSTAMKYTAQNLLWAAKKTERVFNSTIKPLQKAMDKLGDQKMLLADVLKNEMLEKALYTTDQLKQLGLKDKAIEAYTELRKQFDTIWEKQNEANLRMGREPITKLDAYLASIRNGNYVINIVDKEGKLAYSSRVSSKWQAKKAVDWFKTNLDNGKFDLDNLKWTLDDTADMRRVPRDVLGAYQRLGELIDNTSDGYLAVKAAIDEAMDKGGYNLYKQSDRFLAKKNVRGFEGDMPWLSPKENANRLLQSQIDYLRDGYHWTYMQDALANITPILENVELMKQQPNNMSLVKTVISQQTGLTRAVTAAAEAELARWFGFSRGNLLEGTRSIKAFTYLQQLGFSAGYMLATPFQSLNGIGLALRERGLGALSPTVIPKTFLDGFSAIANDIAAEGGLPNIKTPMTKLGQAAFEYAEANGIITKNLFDQQHTIGENRVGKAIKNVGGFTISLPEKVQRTMTFMAFVHHLDEMGVYKNTESLFRRAEELTDMASTNFHASERPTMVGKWGSLGELAYTYHAPIFNYYNQMSMFARDAVNKKNPTPFVGMLAMTAMLGGVLALPGINEIDQGWNLIKEAIADGNPELYKMVSGLGVKGFVATHLPEAAAYGAISELTGAQMSSRFTPNIVDLEQPLSGIAPVGQEMKEWGSLIDLARNPSERKAWQAAYANSPPMLQGLMQTNVDAFKGGKNAAGQVYLNPRDLGNPMGQITRTPEQEAKRAWGLRSLSEAKDRDLQYINNKEQKRVETAYDGLLDKGVMSIQDGNKEKARQMFAKALELVPDGNKLNSEISKKLIGLNTSAEQREMMRANSMDVIQKIMRMRDATK